MKIERAKLKKSNSELPEACKPLRDSLIAAKDDISMCEVLKNVKTWEYGKSELYHWVDVLDKFDSIMESCCERVNGNKWMLTCDQPDNCELKALIIQVMRFTSMLIEYSFQRHSYDSMDHLISLLSSSDMDIVLEVLNVLYVFSKRSNFMGRLSPAKKHEIVIRLQYLAESWGGKENGFGLAECCQDLPSESYPSSATTVHFEFYINRLCKTQPSNLCTIHLEKVDELAPLASDVMTQALSDYEVPENKQMLLFTHIRLAHSFSKFKERTSCILARLQAISVLVYSHAGDNEVAHQIIYNGFINELVNVLELPLERLIDMKAAVMRTLTAIIHMEQNPKLETITDVTGANTYHGFLPSLVRKCILQMVDPLKTAFPHSFSTALFSFLYHLASYERGGEALLSCGIMPSLLQLAAWHSDEQEHITFVTRAVRIIDLITNMCTQSFENHNGLKVFIERLDHEVTLCRQEQPYIIRPTKFSSLVSVDAVAMELSESSQNAVVNALESEEQVDVRLVQQPREADLQSEATSGEGQSTSASGAGGQADSEELMDSQPSTSRVVVYPVLKTGVQCLPQRSALLKSILNFFKKVIPEPSLSFADSIRHIMEGSMPKALQHIISNAEYYGASLFLLALEVVTVFVFQEPSQLSSLQDKGLTEVVLESLLVKDVPTTREVLAALPNAFSALCLNQRGLDAFVEYQPFDKLFKVLLSPEYLPAMKKRKSSDTFGDTANNLGTAMDELMRHQPSLRVPAIKAIIGLLKEIIRLGTDEQFICASKGTDVVDSLAGIPTGVNLVTAAQNSSDIESEDDDDVTEGSGGAQSTVAAPEEPGAAVPAPSGEVKPSAPKPVPLMDYITNVMKFVDAIMGNTSSDDHCMEFITQGGLEPLFGILSLPNLPVDFPNSPACQSVSTVCTVLLKLCHEPKVLEEGLKHLNTALKAVQPLYEPLPPPGGSVLMSELANAVSDTIAISDAVSNPAATPILHSLSVVQAYVKVFVHMCRFGQADLRQISLVQWSTEKGMSVLSELGKLYFTVVWEGTVLLAVCSDNDLPADSDFGRADMAKLLPKCSNPKDMDTDSNSSVGVTAAMEGLSTVDLAAAAASAAVLNVGEEDSSENAAGETAAGTSSSNKKSSSAIASQMKQVRPLLNVSSRLGSTLSELFQVLVKLCVGSVMLRQRRTHQQPPAPPVPSANARTVVRALCQISTDGLKLKPPTDADVPKLQMSFMMCAVGFTLPMLFEESKRSYHLMLQEFANSKGLEAFFDVFDDVLDQLPPPDSFRGGTGPPGRLPDYSIEFLDTWLLLAEKMVHPKYVLESMYPLPEKGNTSDYAKFNPIDYLKGMLKPVFTSILRLWNHKSLTNTKDDANPAQVAQLEQVATSILTIMCHIIQAEKTIKEKEGAKDLSKAKSGVPPSGSTSGAGASGSSSQAQTSRTGLAPVSESNPLLRDLMDMGFSRDRSVEALNFTSTVEQATEYLISHMIAGNTAGGLVPTPTSMDMTLDEDEQIRAAIELSLTSVAETPETKDGSNGVAIDSQPGTSARIRDTVLTSEDLDNLTDNLVSGCMSMLDAMPNTVFKICQLIVTVAKRNGDQWRDEMFKQLFLEITDVSTQLAEDAARQAWGSTKEQAIHYFTKGEKNLRLASRMHLLTLLIQEVDAPCISILQENGFITSVLELVGRCMTAFRLASTAGTPLWLAPIMLIIDQCEKAAIASRRKAEAKRVLGNSSAWRWFDDRNGRWCAYNSTSNLLIDQAYKSGETSVRFAGGRRKYLIHFNAMLQLNEETGNRRPVMLAIPSKEERAKSLESAMDTDNSSMESLLPGQIRSLIKCCVDLISVPVECETLHAVLRLCLRCTRVQDMADVFVGCGGVDKLLELTQASAFSGFTSLCTLIIRHVLEDERTLKQSCNMVLTEVATGLGSSLCCVSNNSMGSKEMHYVMRQLGPAMCREPALLKSLAQTSLKISLQNGKEPPWSTQHQVDILTVIPEKSLSTSLTTPTETFNKIITSLLNILITPYAKEEKTTPPVSNTEQKEYVVPPPAESIALAQTAGTSVLQGLLAATPEEATRPIKTTSTKAVKSTTNDSGDNASSSRPLLSKSCVLRMLSEFTKSYLCCANLIVQHTYLAGQTDLVNETCTALTYIFDKLLPANQEDGDKDCPALSRVLLASIASCNHSPEAQTVLVNELKATLQRTLSMSEVVHKYTHIQSLTGLVTTLVESCPGSQNPQKPSLLMKSMTQQTMNQIVKLMVKRGLVSDLARIPHSLDLSNPATVNTINSLLKPLEILSRIVNQPQLTPNTNYNKPSAPRQAAVTTTATNPSTEETGDGNADVAANNAPNTTEAAAAASEEQADATQQPNGPIGVLAETEPVGLNDTADFDQEDEGETDNSINFALSQRLSEMERQADRLIRLANDADESNEILGQVLDDILSHGRSDHSGDEELDRVNDDPNMSDMDEGARDEEPVDDDDVTPYHEDEEDDTTDEDEDDDEDQDEDQDEEGDNVGNADGGELGMDDDDGWSDEDEIGAGGLANFLAMEDDDDLFSRLEAYDPIGLEPGLNRSRILLADPDVEGFRALRVPMGMGAHELENLNDEQVMVLPPAPNNVPITHPLMNPSTAAVTSERSQNRFMPGLVRTRRPAGNTRTVERLDRMSYALGHHMMQHHTPQNNFLQRLFGAGVAANILQLTTRLGTGPARFFISEDDSFRSTGRTEEEPFNDYFQDGMEMVKNLNGPGILSNIPSTLSRWIEECRVLDGASVHDVITAVKPDIVDQLLADKKEQIEATTKKEREAQEKKSQEAKTNNTTTTANTTATPTAVLTTAAAARAAAIAALADSDGDLDPSPDNESPLLNSMHSLFGSRPDDLARDVAQLYSRTQELRSLMSVPLPQPHTNSNQERAARTITSSVNDSSSSSDMAGASAAATAVLENQPAATAVVGVEEMAGASRPVQSTEEANGSVAAQPEYVPAEIADLPLPEAVSTGEQPATLESSAATAEGTTAEPTSLSVSLASAPEADVEQDRACTPPNIFYDGDEPAQPPQAQNRADEPVPAASSTATTSADESQTTSTLASRSADEPASAQSWVANAPLDTPAASDTPAADASGDEHTESEQTENLPQDTATSSAEPSAPAEPLAASAAEPPVAGTSADAGSPSTLPPGLEGVDPSFLEALPESIRREVIAEQLRLARIQNQVRENAAAALVPPPATTSAGTASTEAAPAASTSSSGAVGASSVADVSAEFLAALPPAIQEEVLAVQRAEQARQTAAAAGPDNSQDPGSFLNSLPQSLRQQVLADMDDSQISVLPADLMAEAHLLRGEMEDRNRRMQSQLFPSNTSLGNILRQSGFSGSGGMNRLTASRFLRRGIGGGGGGFSGPWTSNSGLRGQGKSNLVTRRGRQLLDQEALTCLLVLLFLDEPRLNVSRLHRILKNLGYHNDTLLWIIRALISILIKTNESRESYGEASQGSSKQPSQSAWLSFGMDAALGCRANVFQVQHSSSSKRTMAAASAAASGGSVNIHPQAAQLVCQHVMDTLIYLSKAFTNQFLPAQTSTSDTASKDSAATTPSSKEKDSNTLTPKAKSPKQSHSPAVPSSQTFWDVLIKLDQMRLTRKGKGVQKMSTSISSGALSGAGAEDSLAASSVEDSPLGQLMTLLASPVIRRSPTLTDRLLKLLGNISTAISAENSKPAPTSTSRSWFESGENSTTQPRPVVNKHTVLLPNQLQLAVEVLTSKSCSEEGLEDSTRLLLRLSNANQVTKQNIVKLLLSGAQQIGHTVCQHIESLLNEAREYNKQLSLAGGMSSEYSSSNDLQSLDTTNPSGNGSPTRSDNRPSTSSGGSGLSTPARGLIASRYHEGAIVVAAPKNKTRSHDLQLPSMAVLTSKSSSQQFLLRLLKVVIQLSDKKPAADATAPDTDDATASTDAAQAAVPQSEDAAAGTAVASSSEPSAAPSTAENSGEDSVSTSSQPARMEVDGTKASTSTDPDTSVAEDVPLCDQLALDKLWEMLGLCLTELSHNSDQNAVLILQPAVETFFLVHAGQKDNASARSRRDRHRREDQLSHLNLDEPPPSPATSTSGSLSAAAKSEDDISPETAKFLKFAETHRTVLNQILRQSQTPLSEGPFSVLVDHMKLLDFDVKNRYFKAELQKLDEGMRREDVAVHVRRDHVFEDSYRELFRRTPEEWKHRLYIVFEGEEGQDAGGLLREWYLIMSREIFNPNYALFMITPQDRVTYTINQLSYYNTEHLSYFKFVGRIIAKAIYDNKLLECYFTRSFYKHITGQAVRYTDMEAEDYSFYQGLEFLLTHDIKDIGYDLTFSTEIQELGVTQTRELKPNGANIMVTEENKKEYVKLVCQLKMTGAIRKQLNAFLEGFYDVIPKYLISIFNEQELELLISGLPTVDIDDLKANAEYHKYNANSLQIIWFWRALRSFDQAERARFLQFVTGTSKVPLQGFAYLEGMNGTQKFQIHRDDRSTDRLPCAHTCFNQLDLPAYETFDKLKKMLLLVINECSEGFGLA